MNLHRDRSAWLHGPDAVCQNPPVPAAVGRRLVLLGAPGIGKGTQAVLLSAAFGACHLSTGDLFRAARSSNGSVLSSAMRDAVERMRQGDLVSDATVLDLVRERITCLRCRGGFLLDGFPRTVPQAEALDAMLQAEGFPLDAVVSYELPEAAIIARIGGRRTCPACKAVYHVALQPPRVAGRCDGCDGELALREDDRPAAVHVRQAAHAANTAPLLAYYAARDLLVPVDADGPPDLVFDRTLSALRSRVR